jgi:hypothetical protein
MRLNSAERLTALLDAIGADDACAKLARGAPRRGGGPVGVTRGGGVLRSVCVRS